MLADDGFDPSTAGLVVLGPIQFLEQMGVAKSNLDLFAHIYSSKLYLTMRIR